MCLGVGVLRLGFWGYGEHFLYWVFGNGNGIVLTV